MPLAPEKDACGPEVYARASRHFLGAAVDLREAYAWSWEELARLRAEMTRVSNLVRPGATVAEAMAILDEDPARRVEGRENFRAWMQELAERAISELDGTHFDIPQPAHRIEAAIAPTDDGGSTTPGPPKTRPGPGGCGGRCRTALRPEIAWELLRAHSSWDERQLRSELRRCLGLPGQAPSYKVGERIWLQTREDAMARAGAAFSGLAAATSGSPPGRP
jgi:uncharacterized protein (DUF885 family)